MTGVLIREGGETDRYMRKGHVRPTQRLVAAVSQRTPRNDDQRRERGKESLPYILQREYGPADTLLLDF